MSQPPVFPPAQPSRASGLAITSLVLGILSIVTCLTMFTGIPAVVCGHMALSRIKRSAGALEGRGLALGGLVVGYIGIALFPLLAAIAIPNFVRARHAAQANLCVANLRQIDAAKQMWATDESKKATDTPASQQLEKYLQRKFDALRCPAGGVYSINSVGQKPSCSNPEHKLPD